jgi:hypothetical protein
MRARNDADLDTEADVDPDLDVDAAQGPVVPDYGGACVSNIVPALLTHRDIGAGWIPDEVLDARRVVLLVLDGLGADQLDDRAAIAPRLAAMSRSRITTVAPSTTSSALTSISTGLAPGEHGIVGYKVWVGGEVVNMLRWTSPAGDASDRVSPAEVQPFEPFGGTAPPTVGPAAFADSSFTRAHLRGSPYRGYALPSSMAIEVRAALDEGARFVHAYYDGLDKIAHIAGLGPHFDAELAHVDALVDAVASALPAGVALLVTSDHGQVQVGSSTIPIDSEVRSMTARISGEPRFVWLHARGPRVDELAAAATSAHERSAWIRTVEQVLDERWLGPVSQAARSRLGDVAMVAREPVALVDPDRAGPLLESRHGSMTPAEMCVPLLAAVG